MKPKVCILRSDGTNCDVELAYAFDKYGGESEFVHVNQLRDKSKKLRNYRILALPGGFSYGDDVASGKILAVELISFLKDEISKYIEKEGLIIGICNGFQTLARTGLLPFGSLGKMQTTLAQNKSGNFECRWITLKTEKSKAVFLNSYESKLGQFAVNHGEGRVFTDGQTISKIEQNNLVVFRYVDQSGKPTQEYPQNPNGSLNSIAGLCDHTGRILGMMPHPEKFVDITQHPNWRRGKFKEPHGAFIFKSMIKFAEG